MHGAAPLAATADDASNVKVSEKHVYLSRNVIVKEPSEFGKEIKEKKRKMKKRTANSRPLNKGTGNSRQKKKDRANSDQPCRWQDRASPFAARP